MLNKVIISCCGIAGVLLLRYAIKKIRGKILKQPPQLYGLPFIGSLFTLLLLKNKFNYQLSPQYGDILYYEILGAKFYRIQDTMLLRKVYDKALNRHPTHLEKDHLFTKIANVQEMATSMNHSKDHKMRRNLFIHSLTRMLNSSRLQLSLSKVMKSVTYSYLDLKLTNNNDNYLWYSRELIRNLTFNTMYLTLFDKILDINDDLFKQYDKNISDLLQSIVFAVMGLKRDVFKQSTQKLYKLIESDYYQYKSKEFTLSYNYCNKFDDNIDIIVGELAGFILGGTDTTGHTIEVGILLLAKYPEIQNIILNELKQAIANDNNDNNENETIFAIINQNCPQFRAFCFETLRIACALPTGVPRMCDQDLRCVKYSDDNEYDVVCDTVSSNIWQSSQMQDILDNKKNVIYDYVIKNNCFIEANLGYILNKNVKLWNLDGDPMIPNLNYWLETSNDNTMVFVKNNNSIQFSVGSRSCPGRLLAEKVVVGFFANLLLKYQISAPENDAERIKINYQLVGSACVSPQVPVVISQRR